MSAAAGRELSVRYRGGAICNFDQDAGETCDMCVSAYSSALSARIDGVRIAYK